VELCLPMLIIALVAGVRTAITTDNRPDGYYPPLSFPFLFLNPTTHLMRCVNIGQKPIWIENGPINLRVGGYNH
jgi:hypothetical protein